MSDNIYNKPIQFLEGNLKRLWRCDELIMVGEYKHSLSPKELEFGYISSPFINDRNIYYPINDHKRQVSIRVPKSEHLVEGNYYRVKAKVAPIELRQQLNNPYLLIWDDTHTIEQVREFITPKEFIESWFQQTGSTPKDAATIASQLKLNSLELYTQTERFIFELIQNADDMPASDKGVNVELHLLNNFLIFRHNGKFFDRDDVRAIADAAQSNKSENVRQTGYKGIGFKSVFTDSSCVYIRSGSYSFKFDKNDAVYNDFNALYARQIRLLANSPRDYEQFLLEYSMSKEKYENIDNIPWQIKPIWVNRNEYPDELTKSEFIKHAEVNIALQIGENVINAKNYSLMIESILSKPKFILFLRHTKKFDYYKSDSSSLLKQQSIELREANDLIDIFHNDNHVATFSKLHFDIEINNEEFSKAGFNIERFEEKEGVFKFKDEFGEIKSIPEKLGLLSSTRMTFASQIKDGEVIKLDKSHSILYNYLPTSDQRFGFPFLVNADFITNTSREFILKENKWNQYLMYHIGKNSIKSLVSLCNVQETVDGLVKRKYVKSYLQLLPENLLNEEDEELSEINKSFNRGFLDSINQFAFITDINGDVKRISELILDETQLSKVLNTETFYNISQTVKVLPASEISNHVLKKDYLNIERYTAEKLTMHLQDKDNQKSFSRALSSLDTEGYTKFLEWLDKIYHLNNLKEEWLLQLPIIRNGESILSLSEAIGLKDFVFKTEKTIEIEDILQKLGFILSEFSLDDEAVKHIKQVLLSKESHLQTDTKFYNHITAGRNLSILSPDKKNILLNFFKDLYQIGPSDYAARLELFYSQTGKARSLNKLISNKETEKLPKWLLNFVIIEEEEQAISAEFQKELLNEKDLLEKLFCNLESYNEIITNINSDKLEEFYDYILKLHKNKPEETKIDYSAIHWVYVESTAQFDLASSVYWPDSFAKLLDSNKYSSVKTVIETISDERLPHFSALQIKSHLALGGKEFNLSAITPKENAFDVIAIHDFLDWAETNGEKELLNHLAFTAVGDKFTIRKANDTLAYYTTDKELIDFIEKSKLNTKLSLFPDALYTTDRNKIGLLEDSKLIEYIIEKECAFPSLAKFVYERKDSNLSEKYLAQLEELQIDSKKSYTSDDAEFRILKLVSNYFSGDDAKLDSFREKIILDGVKLLEKAVSADVRIFDADNKFIYQFQGIQISDILPAYKGKTYPVSEIIELFVDFRDVEGLRKIFKAKGRGAKKIYTELLDLKLESYNAAQTLFLSYYQSLYPDEKVLDGKIFFTLEPEVNREAYERELHLFFDYCLNEDSYTEFVNQHIITDFCPDLLLAIDEYAFDTEKLPGWLKAWVENKSGDEVQAFISKMGIKNESSPVVQLRKGLLDDPTVNMDAARGGITEPDLLVNTFEWLITKHSHRNYGASLLKPLYERALALNISIKTLPLPLPTDTSCKTYQLYQSNEHDQYHLIWEEWGKHKIDVWNHLKKSDKIIIDELLPSIFLEQLNPTKLSVSSELDTENVLQNLRDCNLSFYKFWTDKDNYIIKIFKGSSLPRKRSYNDQTISTFYEGSYEKVDNFHIVAESIENALPHSIKDHIPDFFDRLNSWKSDFENNRTERKLSLAEEEAIMKLFDGVVPEEIRKNLNLAALASALVHLDEEGYDVFQANKQLIDTHEYAQLAPVYKDGVQYTVMCRSARLGLLYLTKKAWDRLDNQYDPNVLLFADKGYGEFELFRSKQEVLDVNSDNPTDFQVMRIESRANASELDEMLKGKFEDASRLWIIFRIKGNEHFDKLFFERPETNNNTTNPISARTDDTGGY